MIGKGVAEQSCSGFHHKKWGRLFCSDWRGRSSSGTAIKEAEVVAFEDLGPEAIYRLRVEDFPVTVVIDSSGADLYKMGQQAYRK
jgi:fumarate hydratase subunit beta